MTYQHSIDTLKFSSNPKYQASYFNLRNQALRESFNMSDYDFGEDEYDNEQDTVYVINQDDICIAGARLITRDNNRLPAEEFIDLQQHFDLPTKHDINQVCELSRFVVHKKYHSIALLVRLLKSVANHTYRLKKNKVIYCSSKEKIRIFQILGKKHLGYSSRINETLFYYGKREKTPLISALTYIN